jgi:hypothetical protein
MKNTKKEYNQSDISEDRLQADVVMAFQDNYFKYKDVFHHIYTNPPNEITGALLKAKGLKKGMPDLCLPVKTKDYGSLYIELKLPNEKPTKDQLEKHEKLKLFGNKVVVCRSVEESMKEVEIYLQNLT